eukprot:767136-Hanusia_phi.AAC.4
MPCNSITEPIWSLQRQSESLRTSIIAPELTAPDLVMKLIRWVLQKGMLKVTGVTQVPHPGRNSVPRLPVPLPRVIPAIPGCVPHPTLPCQVVVHIQCGRRKCTFRVEFVR